jgi:hypothetical protein
MKETQPNHTHERKDTRFSFQEKEKRKGFELII